MNFPISTYDRNELFEQIENFLREKEASLRVNPSDAHIIEEAMTINHAQLNDKKTLKKYEEHLKHYSVFLSSKRKKTFFNATRTDVKLFMDHLEGRGGDTPDLSREGCDWCAQRSYPNGRNRTAGWSASTRKGYLSAIRFLYGHFLLEEELPSIEPSRGIKSPRIKEGRQFIPTAEETRRFLAVGGSPNETLCAFWMSYAPERRAPFRAAKWRDIDLERSTWKVLNGKNGRVSTLSLHPRLRHQLRLHRAHMEQEAEHNIFIKRALQDEDRAFVLLTKNGRQVHESTITKMIKQRGIRAGVGIIDAPGQSGSVGGKNSKMTPHALRRGWATNALNDGKSIDVVAEVLGHKDISTTRKHYAQTAESRVTDALLSMNFDG